MVYLPKKITLTDEAAIQRHGGFNEQHRCAARTTRYRQPVMPYTSVRSCVGPLLNTVEDPVAQQHHPAHRPGGAFGVSVEVPKLVCRASRDVRGVALRLPRRTRLKPAHVVHCQVANCIRTSASNSGSEVQGALTVLSRRDGVVGSSNGAIHCV